MFRMCGNAVLVFMNLGALGMVNPKPVLEKMSHEEKLSIVREVAGKYIPKNTDLLIRNSGSHHRADDIDRTKLTQMELNPAPIYIDGDRGVIAVHNEILTIDLIEKKVETPILEIQPSKIDKSCKLMPAITAITCSKMGGDTKQILLGELRGKIFIANRDTKQVSRFGDVPGKVDEIICDPEGLQVAVKLVFGK